VIVKLLFKTPGSSRYRGGFHCAPPCAQPCGQRAVLIGCPADQSFTLTINPLSHGAHRAVSTTCSVGRGVSLAPSLVLALWAASCASGSCRWSPCEGINQQR